MGVATCFALSCRAAATRQRLPIGAVRVQATGEKAPEPPSRLGRLRLEVSIDAKQAAAQIEAIVAEAKALCTVTNSLSAALPIEIQLTPWTGA